ncbi:ABC-2 family transporter protein [Dethiosulfatibacter aminovorans DSM 17477]|uniref:ABC-2 family transporter protein n=1 Tax=Dethiosulfatibacter aminovorans DSM 17477 TaxID=1121476 RepID=A0A1M6JF92_9FIRM|nr:ABC transporter permease [Dethiosulfatibacter aminovorans]SHJ45292.1 ABC-2 family transporter protein [Dethiosulfatibacter aminovorans DSM 17477]
MIEIMKMRIRLFFSRKVLVSLFVMFPLVLAMVSTGYLGSNEVEMRSRIGVVDLDGSELSSNLVERLKGDKTLSIFVYDMEEGKERLKDETVTGLYTIKKGFGESVEAGKSEDLILIEYLSDNYMASGVTDIITPYFMLDVLRNAVLNEMEVILEDEKELEEFSLIFENKALHYGEMEDLKLDVNTETVAGEFDMPLYTVTKEMFIRYLLGMILMFHLVSSFYQSMGLYEDGESRIMDRIRMSGKNEIEYIGGNIFGIGLMIFLVSIIQSLILKGLFFSHLKMAAVAVDLFSYSVSVSSLAVFLSRLFVRRTDYMTAVPFLVTGMWILGNMTYATEFFGLDIPSILLFVPGMASREHIIKLFTVESTDIDMGVVLKEISAAAVMAALASIKKGGRKAGGNRA